MTKLNLVPANVVGLSFGSVLALQLYRDRPEFVTSLVLAAAYAGWAGSLPPEVVEQRMTWTLASADMEPAKLAAAFMPTLLADSAAPELYAEVERMVMDFHPAGVRAMTRAFGPADLRDVLPTISVPTLLIYGDRDVRSSLEVAYGIASRIAGARLAVIPGVGHLNNAEAPERFNAEVRAFLAEAG
jgi:pimeloyl-ACP methyl ester carboxylesterase